MEKMEFLEKLMPVYENYFDIEKDFQITDSNYVNGYVYPVMASFHSKSEKYMLVKSAKIWAHENHEYAYFVLDDLLDVEKFNELTQSTLDYALSLVKPNNEHMYTYVTMVFICNNINNDNLIKEIKKKKFHKSYKFSFNGWCDLRIVAVDLSKKAIYTNSKGKELYKLFSDILSK